MEDFTLYKKIAFFLSLQIGYILLLKKIIKKNQNKKSDAHFYNAIFQRIIFVVWHTIECKKSRKYGV